ncbi:MAG: glutamate-5-semialdehyde dehydrogenase [Bacteroidaceae bacterium]|nr:glutamate-5-semialdehyde dehydrogenase [Bacteroidaceae bacterium]
MMKESFQRTKDASRMLAVLDNDTRNQVLVTVAQAIRQQKERLLRANTADLAQMDKGNPLYDRLLLTEARLDAIANDMENVSRLPSPLGRTLLEKVLPNGLRLRRVSVPFGVIGVIYEARPNVTFDVFSLCFKSGNACILKGGKDADNSNREAIALIHETLDTLHISPDVVTLLPATHEATAQMLQATGYIDVCIPRGGRKLIDFVRDNAHIPVIETGAGVVNAYFDEDGDLEMGKRIIDNAKTRRVSVCNALDCLIIHRSRLADLPALLEPLKQKNVEIYMDEAHYGIEFMDYKLAVKVVDSLDEAIAHISRYGSGHSECIITSNPTHALRFQQMVDAACVYVNAPTSFTDGAQFGLGAEIGISTQKLGPRGPMGLEEITTYKWLIEGNGQTRGN